MLFTNNFEKRKKRVRYKISTFNKNKRHRLSVFRSNKNIYAQLIDGKGNNLISYSSLMLEESEASGKTGIQIAKIVGKKFAELCLKKDIDYVVFDKGGYDYNGRVKALSEACREVGMKF